MAGNHKRNTTGLTQARERKSQECKERVNVAFGRLLKAKAHINFNSISMEAGVTKAYLYTHSDVRERIETLRKQQEGLPSPSQVKREMIDASKDVLLAAKNKRIKELEEAVKRLKGILERRYGEEYEKGL